ncbi:general secretion pathway protein GspK [Cerasicoccus arenae]|uniref:T2SS protein K first SAM-like domain-containing protein n=1 Tax=Cerasicoccus arenae TaxID=424488 RepID=A0A8J3DG50_9BACT|nr:type II secretion system protein GspK [Cerasicoccus arenae]MBK1857967.1 general secretion pathway protein GspK [Cerasicoccus arenae]GHB97769.1 hypothetical protein GCM10007047_12060 [Cerasicoccus arenae]
MNTHRTAFYQDRQARQGGFVLLLVLVFLFLTSVVVVSLLESMTRNIRSAATASARDDLRLVAFSAMEVTLATLAEIKELDEGLYSPSQDWGNPIGYAPVTWPAGLDVSVTVTDETGKLPLDPPDRDTLHQLLDQLGVEFMQAEELIDAYLDWVDQDDLERLNGAEVDYYERLEPPRTPPNAKITSFEDFRYIKGFDEVFLDENGSPNALFKQFKESTSLRHGHPVNINTASGAIVGMLKENSGLNDHALSDLKYGLDRTPGTDDDGMIRSSDDLSSVGLGSNDGFGYESHVYQITIRVEQGEKQFQLTALVDDGSSGTENDGTNQESENGEGGGGNGGDIPSGEVGGGGKPSTGDSNSNEDASKSSSTETKVIYTNGEWRILKLTENGPEDG